MIIECNLNQVAFYSTCISFPTEKGWTLLLRPILVLVISLKPGNRVETLILNILYALMGQTENDLEHGLVKNWLNSV